MPVTTTDRNLESWDTILAELPPFIRSQIKSAIDTATSRSFHDFAIETLERDAAKGQPGPISALLLNSNAVVHAVSSPELCPAATAIQLARAASRLDDRLDYKILRHLVRSPRKWPDDVPEAEILHVFEVIEAISDCERLVVPLMKFAKLPQPHLRSKTVKLMARASRNPAWIELVLADPDPRTRSNLIEGLATQTGAHIVTLLRRGARDPHHRVAVTCLLALCRQGDQASGDEIRRLATEGAPMFRKAAEWALRQLEDAG